MVQHAERMLEIKMTKTLVEKPGRKKSLKNRRRWEYIIKICLKGIGFQSSNFVHVPQDRVQQPTRA
jgi:hypothetical protein